MSPLFMYKPMEPLMDKVLLKHRSRILVMHLSGIYPETSRLQGSLIATHIGKVAVDLRQDHKEKAKLQGQAEAKVVTEFFTSNLVHLLCLEHV